MFRNPCNKDWNVEQKRWSSSWEWALLCKNQPLGFQHLVNANIYAKLASYLHTKKLSFLVHWVLDQRTQNLFTGFSFFKTVNMFLHRSAHIFTCIYISCHPLKIKTEIWRNKRYKRNLFFLLSTNVEKVSTETLRWKHPVVNHIQT